MNNPKTVNDALAQALALSITASTEEKSKAALELADTFAAKLSKESVEAAKSAALILVEKQEHSGK